MDRTVESMYFPFWKDGGIFRSLDEEISGNLQISDMLCHFEQGSSLSKLPTTGVMSLPGMSLKNSSKNHALLFFLQETSPRPEFTCIERIFFFYGKYATTTCTANFVILTQHFLGEFLCVPKNGSGAVLPTPAQFLSVQIWLWTYGFLDIFFYRKSSLSKPCSPNPHFLHHPTMSVKPKVLHRAHSLHILLIPRQEPAQTSSLRSQISQLNVSIAPSIWNPYNGIHVGFMTIPYDRDTMRV